MLFFLDNLLFTLRTDAEENDEEILRFLDSGETDSSVNIPHSLGHYPHHCVGNIHLCEQHGFTLSLWLRPTIASAQEDFYYFSSGGQSHYSEGIFIRQKYGKEFEIGVAKGETEWLVSFNLKENVVSNLALTWDEGIEVFVDGTAAGQDVIGNRRLFIPSIVDPFPELVVGAANDEVIPEGSLMSAEVFNITHWSRGKEVEEIPYLAGMRFYFYCIENYMCVLYVTNELEALSLFNLLIL